jgi:hypothetical protein
LECQFLPKYRHSCNANKPYTRGDFRRKQKLLYPHTFDEYEIDKKFDQIGPEPFWDYVELEFEYNGFTGHIDYIEYYPATNKWVIWDLKTAMTKAVNNPKTELPVLTNVFQIESYAVVLPLIIKEITHIDEYILLYQTRESATNWEPYRVEWTDERKERATKRVTRWTKGFFHATDYINEGYTEKVMQAVVSQRPCISDKSYEREMLPKFKDGKPCPYYSLCTKIEGPALAKKLYATLEDRLDDHRDIIEKQKSSAVQQSLTVKL